METNKISLGALILTCNSELTIENTLKSIVPICKQIFVLDTGSVDSTTSICSRYGAEVHYYKWVDDFSLARNYCMKFLRTDWILFIDSDEKFVINSLLNYFEYFQTENIGGLQVEIVNFLNPNDLNQISRHNYTRIFRNNPLFKFTGKIHEQISPSIIEAGFEIQETSIIIQHFGYSSNNINKSLRNKRLLLSDLENNPNDVWLKYHLAESEFSMNDLGNAKKIFEEIVNSNELSEKQNDMVRIRLAQIALKNDDYISVFNWTDFRSNDIDIEGLRNYILSIKLIHDGNFSNAQKLLYLSETQESSLVDKNILSTEIDLLKKLII